MICRKEDQVCATILAAGTSTRMGRLKPLLRLNDKYMLHHVIHKVMVHPFKKIHIIIGHEGEKIKDSLPINDPRIEWIFNPHYKKGQSTSFLTAIHTLPAAVSSVMIFLGDQPFIYRETISSILEKGLEKLGRIDSPFVIRPVYEQRAGHPVFLANYQSLDFTPVKGDSGGKEVIKSIKNQIFLPVQDATILFDIDTPEDYERAKQISVINRLGVENI